MAMPAGLRRYWNKRRRKGGSKRKRGYAMARRGGYHKPKFTLPLAVVIGGMPLIAKGINDVRAGGIGGLQNTVSAIIPYNVAAKKVDFSGLNQGLYPLIAGVIIHKLAGMIGINRMLSRSGIPFVRV